MRLRRYLVLILAATGLAACGPMSSGTVKDLNIRDWVGHSSAHLIQSWGKPHHDYPTADGGRAIGYMHHQPGRDGTEVPGLLSRDQLCGSTSPSTAKASSTMRPLPARSPESDRTATCTLRPARRRRGSARPPRNLRSCRRCRPRGDRASSMVFVPTGTLDVVPRRCLVTQLALTHSGVLLTGHPLRHHVKVHHPMARRLEVTLRAVGRTRGRVHKRDDPP